jgi:hypothetical protein
MHVALALAADAWRSAASEKSRNDVECKAAHKRLYPRCKITASAPPNNSLQRTRRESVAFIEHCLGGSPLNSGVMPFLY